MGGSGQDLVINPEPDNWYQDYIAIMMFFLGPLLWLILVTQLNFRIGWLAFVCQIQIGFYTWLTIIAYGHQRAGRWTWWGIIVTGLLSVWSLAVAIM
tara:strand:+ start:282 stop:572 length:291 start_codon:yes stop_codon:yes gene_type:complete